MNDLNSANTERFVTLLPSDFSNDTFLQNMAHLKDYHPAVFSKVKNHRCKDYWLCSNPDGSPNIVNLQNRKPIYYASSMTELMEPIVQQIEHMYCHTMIAGVFLDVERENWWKENNPILIKMLDDLYDCGVFSKLQVTNKVLGPLKEFRSDYLPLVRVYGIGLGYHLTELLKRKKISYMTIYEPQLDLFYLSLYTIPWNLIFKYFDYNNKGMHLVLGVGPDQALMSNLRFIESRLTPLTSLFYRYNHFSGLPIIQEVINREAQTDNTHRHNLDAGWYEDQRVGLYISARNIKKGNKFYRGKKIKRYLRVFVVGSGPSLNESISYIKKHSDDAVIISCGSAITPLLKHGIVPDYEVVQERNWHIDKAEERHNLNSLKNIRLLKLNVVSTTIDEYYKETLVFQKNRDPGSVLLQENYPVTADVNPTVSNAGVAFAAELGANEIFLFGVDFGAPKDSGKLHAENTFHEELGHDENIEAHAELDLTGNLGSVIRTTYILLWSKKVTEHRIAQHSNIKWLNVGEGALIAGACPVAVENLPAKFDKKIQKRKLFDEISGCFSNIYSYDNVIDRLQMYYIRQVREYFDALREFTASTPQTREEIISTLSYMYKAASIGMKDADFLPALLVASGVKQFINNVYIQTGLMENDKSASEFFATAKNIFVEYIEAVEKDLTNILDAIMNEDDVELYTAL